MTERPWSSGKFLISAGLRPLEDRPIFLPESNLDHYLENKKTARKESLEKHYPLPVNLTPEEMEITAQVLKARFEKDLPDRTLDLQFPARDGVDLIISQVPEDFSVWKMEDGKEWLALIHLSSPNHWDAREKIGKTFIDSHLPVPHIDPISKAAPKLYEQVLKRGPMERHAWGVATDNRLNHHPEPPPGISQDEWKGRSFDAKNPRLFVRLERQTLFPLTEKTLGFTIKTTFVDVSLLPVEDLRLIMKCIEGMDEAVLRYKGLQQDKTPVLSWLETLCQTVLS